MPFLSRPWGGTVPFLIFSFFCHECLSFTAVGRHLSTSRCLPLMRPIARPSGRSRRLTVTAAIRRSSAPRASTICRPLRVGGKGGEVVQRIKGCGRRLRHPEKLTLADLCPVRQMSARRRLWTRAFSRPTAEASDVKESRFFWAAAGKVRPRHHIRLRPDALPHFALLLQSHSAASRGPLAHPPDLGSAVFARRDALSKP
jgi:hypothetical protein